MLGKYRGGGDSTAAIPNGQTSVGFRSQTFGLSFKAVAQRLWIAQLIVSEATAAKLSKKHGLDHRDVSAAIVGTANLRYVWHDDPERGRRAVVEALVEGRICKIVLYPVEHPFGDVFALGSAYPQ